MRSHIDCLFQFRALPCALHSSWHNGLELQLLAMNPAQAWGFRERTAIAPSLSLVQGKTIDITFVLKKHNWVIKRVVSCWVTVLVQPWPQHVVHFCVHAVLFLCLHQIVITVKKIACNSAARETADGCRQMGANQEATSQYRSEWQATVTVHYQHNVSDSYWWVLRAYLKVRKKMVS